MIKFINTDKSIPYQRFIFFYNEAVKNKQIAIDAIAISSFNMKKKEVDSRYVNLKFIEEDRFIFFSNYNSPKSQALKTHNQISGLIYWNAVDVQIRIKATIKKTSKKYSQNYFSSRDKSKNALAISSDQSAEIDSYKLVKENHQKVLNENNLFRCPEYWGGFSFTPYYFEFWEGHESRVNKREVFNNIDGIWKHSFLQP